MRKLIIGLMFLFFPAVVAAQCVTNGGYPASRLSQKKVVDALYHIDANRTVSYNSFIAQGLVFETVGGQPVTIKEKSNVYIGLINVCAGKCFWVPETAIRCD